MRLPFLHQNYPGQFRRLGEAFCAPPAVEVLGLGDAATTTAQRHAVGMAPRQIIVAGHDVRRRGLPAYRPLIGL